jgi:hypothetical protein
MKKPLGVMAIVLLAFLSLFLLGERTTAVEGFEVDPAMERVRFLPASPTLLSVSGADWVEGSLYALDPVRSEVVVLEQGDSGWSEAFAFGGEGAGPGELRSPMDVLWLPGPREVVVLTSDHQAHYFSKEGAHLRDQELRLPCTLGRRSLALRGPDDFWVSGNCAFSGNGGDTVYAVAAGRDEMGGWTLAARVPRYTMDGAYGTPFGIQDPTAGGPTESFLNGGNDLCLSRLAKPGQGSSAGSGAVCLPGRRFTAPEPSDYQPPPARFGGLFAWPDPLPAISGAGLAGHHLTLVRMYGADSAFVVEHDLDNPEAPGRILAGAPFSGLVGCRSYGCLWFQPGLEGNRIAVFFFPGVVTEGEGTHGH